MWLPEFGKGRSTKQELWTLVKGHPTVATWPDGSRKNEYPNLTFLPFSLLQLPSFGQAQCEARGQAFLL